MLTKEKIIVDHFSKGIVEICDKSMPRKKTGRGVVGYTGVRKKYRMQITVLQTGH